MGGLGERSARIAAYPVSELFIEGAEMNYSEQWFHTPVLLASGQYGQLLKSIKNYKIPPFCWNRYTREGRDILRENGFPVLPAVLPEMVSALLGIIWEV